MSKKSRREKQSLRHTLDYAKAVQRGPNFWEVPCMTTCEKCNREKQSIETRLTLPRSRVKLQEHNKRLSRYFPTQEAPN